MAPHFAGDDVGGAVGRRIVENDDVEQRICLFEDAARRLGGKAFVLVGKIEDADQRRARSRIAGRGGGCAARLGGRLTVG